MKVRIIFSIILVFVFTSFTNSQNIEWFTFGSGLSSTSAGVAVLGGDIYVGGQFALAGGVLVHNIAKWDGTSWSALGTGVNGYIKAVAMIGSEVYVAGFFSEAGGVAANNIAKWDGNNWSALGDGVNELVLCLTVNGTDLYAGGFFTEAGGVPANRIARWDGVSWSPLGDGINNEVNAIAVSENDVYAGGIFNLAGGTNVSGLARWDGNNWYDVGGGVNGIVRTISIAGNDVYVGGVFTMVGGNVPGRIARWDGSSWHTLGDGVNGSVFSTKQSGNDLYVGGMFTIAGNQNAIRIAKFDMVNSTWSPVGDGTSGSVDAMAVQETTGSMIIGGSFGMVGNNIQANYIARFTDSENPLPVELVSFTADQEGNDIKLNWNTLTEINNKGFEVERSSSALYKDWKKIGFVQGSGTTTDPRFYTFTDDNLTSGFNSYRLKQIDFDGTFSYSDVVEVDIIGVRDFILEQNYPNPFNPSTKIKFTVPFLFEANFASTAPVSLKIYDVLGNEIATLVNEEKFAGTNEVTFDATSLPNGIYLYKLQSGKFSAVKKMILLK